MVLGITGISVSAEVGVRQDDHRDVPPSETIATPKKTPASLRMSAGLLLRGGPGSDSLFAQLSGPGCVAVRISGIFASAIS